MRRTAGWGLGFVLLGLAQMVDWSLTPASALPAFAESAAGSWPVVVVQCVCVPVLVPILLLCSLALLLLVQGSKPESKQFVYNCVYEQ